MNDLGKMNAAFARQIARDPKLRKYLEKTFTEAADITTLQKYGMMYLTGKAVVNGEVIDLDEKGAIPEILEMLDEILRRLDRIEKKLKGE